MANLEDLQREVTLLKREVALLRRVVDKALARYMRDENAK